MLVLICVKLKRTWTVLQQASMAMVSCVSTTIVRVVSHHGYDSFTPVVSQPKWRFIAIVFDSRLIKAVGLHSKPILYITKLKELRNKTIKENLCKKTTPISPLTLTSYLFREVTRSISRCRSFLHHDLMH